MPYIKDENNRRKELRNGAIAKSAGELNFQIFAYVKNCEYEGQPDVSPIQIYRFVINFMGKSPNYQKYNDMIGCLTACYNEINRRMDIKLETLKEIIFNYQTEIAFYEDIKIKENGDV